MRSSWIPQAAATAVVFLARLASGLNIIINNDDGWATANIREFYKALNEAGHNAWIVAPVSPQSGKGGTTVFTTEPRLTAPGLYNSVPAGAPSFGTDPNDSHIWYYNGTPAAVTFFALDYVIPRYWNGTKPDLVVAGPNEGGNTGAFLYTLSGTIGATYSAVERDIPAIGFSAADGIRRPYTEVNDTAPGGLDPATITGRLGAKLVQQLADNAKGKRLLPSGYGINVNYPKITSLEDDSCIDPPFIQTRLTGDANVDLANYDESTGLFTHGGINNSPGLNTCINGDCSLPGEAKVVKTCQSSVSIFTVDYDAPNCQGSTPARTVLQPLVRFLDGTGGDSDSTGGRSSNTTQRGPEVPIATGAAPGFMRHEVSVFACIVATVVLALLS
ncbi:MAG: hypothetical protein M1837_002114 [Sclerophora amabilis]|nr:MAG: hypothetical protein M1837_002114 [Sclerophora amabilis]